MSYNKVSINSLFGHVGVEDGYTYLEEAGLYDEDETLLKVGEKLHDVIYLSTGESDSASFLGCRISKVPQKLLSIFKDPFERTQNFVFHNDMETRGDIDVEAYAEDFVPDYDVLIEVREDDDNNYIVFNSTNNEILGIESRISKEEFWSKDFGKNYPKMMFLKEFVSAALSEWEKRGIDKEKIDSLYLTVCVNILTDFDKLQDYEVYEGITREYGGLWDVEDPMTEGTYSLVYVIVSRVDKSRRKLEALRSIMKYKIENDDWDEDEDVSDEELLRLEELRVTDGDRTIALDYDFVED